MTDKAALCISIGKAWYASRPAGRGRGLEAGRQARAPCHGPDVRLAI